MSRGKELVKNTAIVAVGKVCTKFLSFFLLPFYTAILSTEDYGIVDLFNSYIALLLPVVIFQIEDAIFRFMIEVREQEEEKQKVISTAIGFCMLQSIVFTAGFLIVQQFFVIPYRWYFLANMLVSIFSGAMLQLTRGLGDNASYAFGSFLNALTAILLNIVLVLWLKMGADGLFITAFLSNLIGIFYIVWKEKVCRYFKFSAFDRAFLKEMLAYSLPLVPNYLSWWVIGASDKSIVTWVLGRSQNGILAVSQKFSTMYTTFYGIFNLTWTESAAMHREDEDHERYYSEIIDTSFRVLVSACLGIIAVVALIFPLLINVNYGDSYYQIPIYMLSSLLYSVIGIYSVVYVAFKKTGKIARTSMLAAVINIVVNVALVRTIGLYAASISSVIAYGVLLLARLLDIRKFIRIRTNKAVVCSSFILLMIDFIVYYVRSNALSFVNLLLIAAYAAFLNRKMLAEIIALIRKRKEGENLS